MGAICLWICLVSLLSVCGGVPEYRAECQVWNNVTDHLNHQRGVMVMCQKNIQCTGFDCSGLYKYQGIYTLNQAVEINYCFGMTIHPCHTPVDISFFVHVPQQDIRFQRTVVNSTDVKIPGLHMEMQGLGEADAFVSVRMSRLHINGHLYLDITMVMKVRLQGTIAEVGEWPESMQQTLLPRTQIPVPRCEKDVVTPSHNFSSCARYTTPKPGSETTTSTYSTRTTTSSTPAMNSSSKPNFTASSTTDQTTLPPQVGKTCNQYEAYSCPGNQMCRSGRCTCQSNFHNINGNCVRGLWTTVPTTPFFIPEPVGTIISGTDGGNNTKAIIIGGCVGAVVLILLILGVLLFVKYRNHQLRYGNHQLLINNEEEDDDEPIDVST